MLFNMRFSALLAVSGCILAACEGADRRPVVTPAPVAGETLDDDSTPPPCLTAAEQDCKIGCPYGYHNDARGCDTCECSVRGPAFPNPQGCDYSIQCPARCEEGYGRDERGCATCECAPPLTDDYDIETEGPGCTLEAFFADCKIGCPYGYRNDERGCEMCECSVRGPAFPNPKGCDYGIQCPTRCEEGYGRDERGCATCECAPPLTDDYDIETEGPGCTLEAFFAECKIGCPYGYSSDERGCEVCECDRPPPGFPNPQGCDYSIQCPARCEEGYGRDERGCLSCECAPPLTDDNDDIPADAPVVRP